MGDDSSFNQIYQDHVDMVYNLSLNYLHRQEDAEEVTQDVFLKVHEKLKDFQARSTLKTWIYRLTVNKCLDHIKAQKRKKRFGFMVQIFENRRDNPKQEIERIELAHFDHPGVLLEDREALASLFAQIDELPEKQKTALILKAMDGLPVKEIAEVMELNPKAVESLLSRAKANLRKMLEAPKDSERRSV